MGGGRTKDGVAIYRRVNGVYVRRDGRPIKHREKNTEKPSTLKNFDGYLDLSKQAYDKLTPRERKAIDAGIEAIRKYIEKADFRIRVTDTAMNGILDSGEVWNQMQVGRSGGAYNPELRRNISQTMFGHDGNLSDEEYEKYGYLSDGQTDAAYWYGDFDIVLKKDAVIDRTTMTLGDSLDYSVKYPSYVGNPQWISSGRGQYVKPYTFRALAENLLKTGKFYDDFDGYAELQFHGRITVNEISHVSMSRSWATNPPPYAQRIIDRLTRSGIEIRYDAIDS